MTRPVWSWLRWGALPVVLALAYLPSLTGGFIWNDSDYLTAPGLRSLGGLRQIWFQPGATQQYYPLLHSFFWGQFHLWGLHPLAYRLFNLGLHGLAAVLFGHLVDRLWRGPRPGWCSVGWAAGLIFALHPVNAETVAWITEEKNTLSLVLYLAAARLYLQFDERRSSRAYLLALVCFVLAVLAKTVTATLPAALLVVLWWQRGSLAWRRDVWPLLPWLALGAAGGLFASWVERHYVGAEGADFEASAAVRALVSGRAILFYLGQLLWPARLSFLYARWNMDPGSPGPWGWPAAALLLGAAAAAGVRRSRGPLAAYLLFVGSLFPVLGFVNLYGARYSWVWDHWQYLPDLSPIVLVVGALAAGLAARWPERPGLFPAAVLPVAGVLGLLTWQHCQVFRSDEILYRRTLDTEPAAWMAHNNLGRLLLNRGDMEEALQQVDQALALNERFPEAHNNRAVILLKTGERTAGLAELRRALEIDPRFTEARVNLGLALIERPGTRAEGIDQLRTGLPALADPFEAARLHATLGEILLQEPGGQPAGWAELEKATQLDPTNSALHGRRGIALFKAGQIGAAAEEFQAAVRLSPASARAHNDLGIALIRQGRTAAAIAQFQQALRLDPSLVSAQQNLSLARARQ